LLMQGPSAFQAFLDFSDWLWQTTGKTSGLTPEDLVDNLFEYLAGERGADAQTTREALLADYLHSGARASPRALQGLLQRHAATGKTMAKSLTRRQEQHVARPL